VQSLLLQRRLAERQPARSRRQGGAGQGLQECRDRHPNYPGGKDAVSGFKRFYKGKVADEIYTKLGQLDYAAELAQIRATKPDALFFFLPGGMGINFVKQFVAAGLSRDTQLPRFLGRRGRDQGGRRLDARHVQFVALGARHGQPENKRFVADFQKEWPPAVALRLARLRRRADDGWRRA
jgi:ABC-type branched-subunit amino acid transport system substrate-binding protein